jgi:uncharacterized SAM-binding protein YcdF (DUF218 family)
MTRARRLRQQSSFLTSIRTKLRKKSPLSSLVALFLFVFFLVIIAYCSLQRPLPSDVMAYKQRQRLFFSPEDLPTDLIHSWDAILVLGGGRPKSIDHPPVFVERRCDDAIDVIRRRRVQDKRSGNFARLKGSKQAIITQQDHHHHHQHQHQHQQHLPILCLSAGTAHVPQLLSADGLPIWESTACAAYILSKNNNKDSNATTTNHIIIPPESIYAETTSYDTIGNAYFSRTSHTEFNGWRKLLIVTNEFHMTRTMKIFDWVFSVPSDTASTITTRGLKQLWAPYELYYLESPNAGMASEVAAARKEREALSSKSVDYLSKKYSTLREVYGFLTREHSLYAANRLVDRGRATAADVEEGSVKDVVKRSYGAN